MNPLASNLRVTRVLLSLAAAASLFLTAGCSSSSSAKANQVGFGNSSLNGTYVFSSIGSDSSIGAFLAVAGTFTANGTGGSNGITAGTIDINGFDLTSPISTAITGGNYTVNSDGRGAATLTWSGGSIVLDFVLTAPAAGPSGISTHGLVTEFDGNGTGSGTLDLQNSGSLQGAYSFGLTGASGSASSTTPLGMAGSFTPNNGNITGLSDINANGVAPGGTGGLTLTGTVTAGSPGTAVLNSFNGNTLVATYNFDVYEIDPTHLKFIETDTGSIMAGDAFTQQTSLPQGGYAYVLEGEDSSQSPMALGGYFNSDGSSVITSGLEDYNDAGTVVNESTTVAGSFIPFSGGRTELSLTGFFNGNSAIQTASFAAYPSSGGVQLLENDGGGITSGYAITQGSTSSIPAANYALNLSAINGSSETFFEEDDIAQFAVNGSNYTGVEDINDAGSTTPQVAFNGTFTADTTVAGHGSAASSTGQFNFNYYLANGGETALILETDDTQLGVGSFEFQTTSAAQAAHHASMPHFTVMRPGIKRSHSAFRGKVKQ